MRPRLAVEVTYTWQLEPTAKKLTVVPLDQIFENAEESPALTDEDRAALCEAGDDPRWTRMSRGDAFERLVCDADDEK